MNVNTRRWIWLAMVLMLLATPMALASMSAVASSPKVRATKWVKSLSTTELRSAVADINSLPVARQNAVFQTLTNADKSKFWQARLTQYLETHPGLPVAGESAVRDAMKLLSPEYFQNQKKFLADTRRITAEIQKNFDRETFDYLMGSPQRPDKFDRAMTVVADWARGHFIIRASFEECDCSSLNPCGPMCACGVEQWCGDPPPSGCHPGIDNCWAGWLTWVDCSGLCGVLTD